ncbi:astacin (Peptidase family m12A) domain-containing protein [Phthorimaea operculella]|nr:astacin (Peptidase family m12A) domain-containing protein [Phthorimaea operculella]
MLKRCLGLFILLILELVFVQCSIPNLSVRQVDSKLIERKRMDTLEMCRIFENEQRLKQTNSNRSRQKKRGKREIASSKLNRSPALKEEDVNRVESIVDKLYDDLTEHGKRVTYRQREKATTKIKNLKEELFNQSSRRFDFAPKFLIGPDPPSAVNQPPETVPVPWIKHWKHGIIPYFIDPKTYDNGLAEIIMQAFDYFERATCIRLQRLREKPTDKMSIELVEWVYITNPMGIRQCVHSNEWIPNKGVQMVVFGYDCMSTGEIVHEVMHILGFAHEHNRPDRDGYVSIMWDNIKPGYKKYFEMRSQDVLLRLPYDYASVLHYPPRAFSKNGQITVSAKAGVKIGQREGLSQTDVEKVALIFGNECVDRNKDYLLTTCPSVVKIKSKTKVATQQEIQDYFKDRIWQYGIVNYKLHDHMEFSAEERENIQAVIKHIEKETCIEFQDIAAKDDASDEKQNDDDDDEEDDGKEDDSGGMKKLDNDGKPEGKEGGKANVTTDVNTKEKEHDNNDLNNDGKPETNNIENEVGSNEMKKLNMPENAASYEINRKRTRPRPRVTTKRLNQLSSTENPIQNDTDHIISLELGPMDHIETTATNMARVKRSGLVTQPQAPVSPPTRRHASSVLVFKRSAEPGCKCPPPGGKGEKEDGSESENVIELNADCFNSVNDLLHVFVHILGLDHQHNMHDRDDFLHIVWDELTPEIKKEMEKKLPPAAAVGFPYDYQSVMHYPWLQIKDGVTNIMYPIWNDGWAMGHWQGLSSTDVQKLSLLYFEQCLERKKHETQDDQDDKL